MTEANYFARIFLFAAALAWLPISVAAQTPLVANAAGGESKPTPNTYVLGPGDQILVSVLDVEDIGKQPYRIDMHGSLDVPLAGHVQATGLTLDELEAAIREKLTPYIRDPDVTVSLEEMRSQPVSVLGEVRNPGVIQLMGHKSLFEVLSLAGGLTNDAGYSITITRAKDWGTIPLPGAHLDSSGEYWVAQVSVKDVMEGASPDKNILVMPDDVISVPKGVTVYVLGAVKKSGGFVLGENSKVTVLQALALAEGLDKYADTGGARILRKTSDPAHSVQINFDLKRIMDGKTTDIPLQADDILSIPLSGRRQAMGRTGEAVMQIGTGIAIWRPY